MKFTCSRCGKSTDNETQVETIGIAYMLRWCDACNNKWNWQHENEALSERTIICPYCCHEYDDYDACGYDEGEHEEIECQECGKKFDLEVIEVREYSTKRSLCEMPEDFGVEEETK